MCDTNTDEENIMTLPEYANALEGISSLYEDARHLVEEQSKRDPITQPHLSFWAGIHIFLDIIGQLNKMLDNADPKHVPAITPRVKAIIGGLWCKIGAIYMDIDEPAIETQFRKCLDYLEDDSLNPNHVIALVSAFNGLGLIYSQRDQLVLSREYLEKAEKIFHDFTNSSSRPLEIRYMFNTTTPVPDTAFTDSMKDLEGIHTLTLYYLAQVYGKLNDHLKSAVYCHSTLKRQLESKNFDPIDWALNAATLSQYFTEKNRFLEARHHLSAASHILDRYDEDLNSLVDIEEEELNAKRETFNHRRADVARCWCKYGILLLTFSRERLMIKSDQDDEEEKDNKEEVETDIQRSDLWFTTLDLPTYESQVTAQYVLMFDDARLVFLNAQDWLNKAKEYYSLENHASDYAELIRDHSDLYKSLVFFEENDSRQCCMHKRRTALLEGLLGELNVQYYTNVCRQLRYEVAEAYSEMLDIKLTNLQASQERPTPHALKKINSLAEESIKNFNLFLDTLKDSTTKEMPVKIPDELVRPALLAYFHIGRLCHKIIVADKKLQIENTQSSLDAYKYLVDYCGDNENAAKQMNLELGVVKEMVQLLPLKIAKLLRETPT